MASGRTRSELLCDGNIVPLKRSGAVITSGLADDPGMIGKGYADLRDLPPGGTRIGIIRKLPCHSFRSRSRFLPAI
jgi:hypothetical protein